MSVPLLGLLGLIPRAELWPADLSIGRPFAGKVAHGVTLSHRMTVLFSHNLSPSGLHPSRSFRVAGPSCFPTSDAWELQWPYLFLQELFLSVFFTLDVWWYVLMVSICLYLMANDVEHLLKCLFAIHTSSLISVCWTNLLSILWSGWLFPCYQVLRIFKYILEISPFLDMQHMFSGLYRGESFSVISRGHDIGHVNLFRESAF